jgi:hypothetical protein
MRESPENTQVLRIVFSHLISHMNFGLLIGFCLFSIELHAKQVARVQRNPGTLVPHHAGVHAVWNR